MSSSDLCPCGSGLYYAECCGVFHNSPALPPTAEALMRSRYSAFVRVLPDYLMATTHSHLIPQTDRSGLQSFAQSVKWLRLTVQDTAAGQPADSQGQVEFQAWFEEAGKLNCIWERSHFEWEDGRWKYHSGTQKGRPRVGRNDPCPCGSGKKYKKCHG